jgi:hypothetical protein
VTGRDETQTMPIDRDWAARLIDALAEDSLRFDRDLHGGDGPNQVDLIFQSDRCADLGLLRSALGAPAAVVREHFRDAVRYGVGAFRLRATWPAPGDEDLSVLIGRQGHWSTEGVDQSLTNSRRGLRLVHLALATGAGRAEAAREVAALVGDPHDADYLGADSVVCSWDDQHVAYALAAFLLNDPRAARAELRAFSGAGSTGTLGEQAEALRALLAGEPPAFLDALGRLLAVHREQATRRENWKEPLSYLCLPAVGLAAVALDSRLVSPGRLPADDALLPLGLILPSE